MSKILVFISSCFELVRCVFCCLFFLNRRNKLSEKAEIKPIAILGNGKSLSDNIDNFENCDICTVNFSPFSDVFFNVKPKYHVLYDDVFFYPNSEPLKKKVECLKKKINDVDWDLTIIVPFLYLDMAIKMFGNNSHIHFLSSSSMPISDQFLFKKIEYLLFKKGFAHPMIFNVGVAALFFLINCGYKKIYLYGMEHSWIKSLSVDKDNNLCLIDAHFYDKKNTDPVVILLNGRPERMHEQLRFQANAFASYWEIKGYADFLGDVEIINRTKDSFIDAFRKE